ncbi:hypothetical protein AGABI2DRAFT_194283 [Agaricus bisporus var. bisporus H97]|uniref:hypothetical protein n=1 Tax=Agaricus bisporus var. bisporus (strain H97 / ATCC MYA-4626 / FGSC 10389) TaxID=936046 RepID=UPI00029F769F|nr:hypothetical protein AGABI2DRAFT_194283 [Agaricus bisporus var. bisporus H97]EKV45323.1 hypothetical protein AGABI2DRAFT_194283 [Agaricus bisporus var. bisporus H97]
MQYQYSEGDLVGSSAMVGYLLECVVLSSHDHEKQSGFARVEMKLEHPVCRQMDSFVCPSSGRVYYVTDDGKMVIADIPGLY